MKHDQHNRERKLTIASRNLERALEIVNELTWNANGVNNVDKANAWGILTLEKLGVIQLVKENGSTFAVVNS